MNIICFSGMQWNGQWQRHHEIMSRLRLMGYDVIYVEPTNILEQIAQKKLPKRISKLPNGIILVRPIYFPLHARSSLLRRIDRIRTMRLINQANKRFGYDHTDILWTFGGNFNYITHSFKSSFFVYDCSDACEWFLGDDHQKQWFLREERETADQTDLIFVTSKGLKERFNNYPNKTVYAPNGTGDLLVGSYGEIPIELKELKRPVVGFVGALQNWIDFKLLSDYARTNPEITLVLVGPIQCDDYLLTELRTLSNVRLLGPRDHSQVGSYMLAFDVCIIPFIVDSFTNSACPIKLFEYLSLGKPVVTTPLRELEEFGDVICISKSSSAEDFADAIHKAINEDKPGLSEIRKNRVKLRTWQLIIESMEREMKQRFDKKRNI